MKSSLQDRFFERVAGGRDFLVLLEHLEGISFFLKDSDFRIVAANPNFFSRLGFKSELEIIGRDDFELFPRPLAAKFRKDDEMVLKTGQSMPKLVELFLNRHGLPDWFLTNKFPIHDCGGRIAGVMGTVERYNQKQGLKSSHPAIARAVEVMLTRPGEVSGVADLAREQSLSHRHFDRRFKEETGLSPRQFLNRARIQMACHLLRESHREIADLAIDLGFCDQSAFTAQFRKQMGITPLRYRRQFGGG